MVGMSLGRWVGSLLVLVAPLVAAGAPALSDAPDGVTCRFVVAAARMPWLRAGGDWVDAAGLLHGTAPFAGRSLTRGSVGQSVAIDLLPLVRAWRSGRSQPGMVLLAAAAGEPGSSVRLHSREAVRIEDRPVLRLTAEDGHVTELNPVADASLNCSTINSLGGLKTLTIGRERRAIVAFAVPPGAAAGVRAAQISFKVEGMSGRRATLAVMAPQLPWQSAAATAPGLSMSYPGDLGIERHPGVVYAQRFEGRDWDERLTPVSRGSHAAPTKPTLEKDFVPLSARALAIRIPAGKNLGLNVHFRFADQTGSEPEEMYFRYSLRLGADWDPVVSGGKLFGFSGTYGRAGWGGRKSDGTNGWVAQGAFFEQAGRGDSALAERRGVGSYVYHADMEDRFGDSWGWGLATGGILDKSRWYSVEQYLKLNTPGRQDGVMRAWIDGILVFEKTDIRFRLVPDLRIESLWLNVWHGGTKPAVRDMTLYVDNLVIARGYIGPFRPTTGPTTAR